MEYRYKNISSVELTIMAEGNVNPRVVAPGQEVEASVEINNPNLQRVDTQQAVIPSESSSVPVTVPADLPIHHEPINTNDKEEQ